MLRMGRTLQRGKKHKNITKRIKNVINCNGSCVYMKVYNGNNVFRLARFESKFINE